LKQQCERLLGISPSVSGGDTDVSKFGYFLREFNLSASPEKYLGSVIFV